MMAVFVSKLVFERLTFDDIVNQSLYSRPVLPFHFTNGDVFIKSG